LNDKANSILSECPSARQGPRSGTDPLIFLNVLLVFAAAVVFALAAMHALN
jgi:hypothetical protein